VKQGLLALQGNQLAEARTKLEEATRLDAQNGVAWISLAEVYRRLQLKTKALSAATRAAESVARTGDTKPAVQHALAMFYSETQDFKLAATFEEQFARSPAGGTAALERASGFALSGGDETTALRLATEAAEHDSSPVAKDLLGRAAWAAGEWRLCV
jgi:Flp pilus assembly protein TadD